ncbi:MAG: acyl carrier protein [Planctomycetota bacterium]|jgi:acyl carrier protein
MDPKQIEQKVIDIVVEQLDVSRDQVAMETRFVDDLGADSLDQAELVMEFEDEFDLDIPENDESIRTVGDAVKYIEAQVAKKK